MSSLGGQWRIIRHYLSMSNLNSEVEKLVQKIKPATPEQWESLIKKFERAVSARLSQTVDAKSLEEKPNNKVNATTIEETDSKVQKIKEKNDKDEKISQEGLTLGSEAKEITFEGLWQGLKLKKDLHFGKISEPSWKTNKPIITKTSIHSRTAYVISAIVTAESTECLLKRTEHFIEHLQQYPESRDYAIKEGAVRALLRVQHKLKKNDDLPITKEVNGLVNEALALMGYTGPTKSRGPNILSIDGGGIRGIIAIEILRHLERLTGRKVEEMFDYIIGVSTGAIIAAVMASGAGNLETATQMYHTLSKQMFGNTSLIGGTSRLVWSHSYYDTDAWEELLQENLKDCTLTECNRHNTPKMALVSCVVNSGSRLAPFLFRTYECGFRVRSVFPGSSRARLWQAVRASAAAPTYFTEFRLHGLLHQVLSCTAVLLHCCTRVPGQLARAPVASRARLRRRAHLLHGVPPARPAAPGTVLYCCTAALLHTCSRAARARACGKPCAPPPPRPPTSRSSACTACCTRYCPVLLYCCTAAHVFPGSSRARLWQAVRASAAAPTYFTEFRLHGLLHQVLSCTAVLLHCCTRVPGQLARAPVASRARLRRRAHLLHGVPPARPAAPGTVLYCCTAALLHTCSRAARARACGKPCAPPPPRPPTSRSSACTACCTRYCPVLLYCCTAAHVFPGSSRARLWQAVRASAAAPTYFTEFRLHGLLHQVLSCTAVLLHCCTRVPGQLARAPVASRARLRRRAHLLHGVPPARPAAPGTVLYCCTAALLHTCSRAARARACGKPCAPPPPRPPTSRSSACTACCTRYCPVLLYCCTAAHVFPGSSRARLWQAVRASAAAPTYFTEFRLHGLLHQVLSCTAVLLHCCTRVPGQLARAPVASRARLRRRAHLLHGVPPARPAAPGTVLYCCTAALLHTCSRAARARACGKPCAPPPPRPPTSRSSACTACCTRMVASWSTTLLEWVCTKLNYYLDQTQSKTAQLYQWVPAEL
ncbi:uncharacterized protein LOC123664554 [Melitaea cinxia]|uniref:uncharacterized protein LOC123664554 n=1 Tax=Melitaea cinxia TaxID=113334 RepID=UPI001E273BA7|nr:uncharacterized protein LOC123664554 [Melitaea cinxia]